MTNWNLPIIDHQKCTLCGLCVEACPEHVFTIEREMLMIQYPQKCVYCTDCESVCPENAVSCFFEIKWFEPKGDNVV